MSNSKDVNDTILALMDTVAEQVPGIPDRILFYGELMRHLSERGVEFDFDAFKGTDEAWDEALLL